MKVLIYTELLSKMKKSGIGKATEHQIKALKDNNIQCVLSKKNINDVDLVHINYYGLGSYMLAKKAKRLNKKIIYHAHSTEEDFKNSFIFSNALSPLFKKWICKCYKLGDYIITPTDYSKSLLEWYNLNKKIEVLSNGIDLNFFKKSECFREEFRKKYNIKTNDIVIISVGLYLKRKGILNFIELAKEMPEYKFIWFGSSPLIFAPQEIKKALNTKIDNLLFAGFVEQKELRKAYSGCDLFLFMTYEETEGIVVLESLATKTKTLIRNIPVYDNWLKDNINVYKANTKDEFKAKIKLIINNEIPDLTENGYYVAKEREIRKTGKKLISIYKKALKGN